MSAPVVELDPGHTAVVGYGLLLSQATVEKTLGGYEGPFVHAHVSGWRRTWDVSMPNAAYYYEDGERRIYPDRILYLNVRRRVGEMMNCTVFALNEDRLGVMNAREWIYDPITVTPDLRGVRVEGGNAVIYVGKARHRAPAPPGPEAAALRRSYLRMLERVLEEAAPSVHADYRATTDPVPEHLVVEDVLDPDRPHPPDDPGDPARSETRDGAR